MALSSSIPAVKLRTKTGLRNRLKAPLVSFITGVLAFSLCSVPYAFAESGKRELRGGHLDAFYVFNDANKVTKGRDGQYNSHVQLLVREDITGTGVLRRPEEVKLISTHKTYSCLSQHQAAIFASVPGIGKGAYFSNNGNLHTTEIMAPGYSHYAAFPDPEDPKYPYVTSDVKIVFSDVSGPKDGYLVPYGIDMEGKLFPELDRGQLTLANGAQWTFESEHHHSLWLATKAGTYTFTAQAIVNIDEGPYKNLEFKSEPATYTWEFEKSDQEGPDGCGASSPQPGAGSQAPSGPGTSQDPAHPQDPETSEKPDEPKEEEPEDQGTDEDENFNEELSDPVSLDRGHTDIFNVNAAGDALRINIKEDITGRGVLRTPESVKLVVKESAFQKVLPKQFNPKLMDSGYYLPQSQGNGLLWPGWETLGVKPDFESIDINFLSVSGPGRVQLAMQGAFGSSISQLKDGSIDLRSGSVIPVPDPTHVHTNWFFEKPGTYTMIVKATGRHLKTGKTVSSNIATYTWQVGDDTEEAEEEQKDKGDVSLDTILKAKDGTPLVVAGTKLTFNGSGFIPGEAVKVTVHSDPVVVASGAIADAKGNVRVSWQVPADFTPGKHKVIMQGKKQKITTRFTVAKDEKEAEEAKEDESKEDEKENPLENLEGKSSNPGEEKGNQPESVTSFAAVVPSERQEVCIPTKVEVEISAEEAKKAASRPAGASLTQLGGSVTIGANTHVHPNWVFTKPGKYQVGITQSATLKNGKRVSTRGVLNFTVGGAGNANSGHFDVGSQVKNGQLIMAVRDDRAQPASWVSPSSLNFGLGNAAKAVAPAGMEFIAKAGTPVWIISSAQVGGVPWVGANTQDPSFLAETTGSLTWTLDSVTGPGALAVFTSGNLGQLVGQKWFGGQSSSGTVNSGKLGSVVSGQALANGVTMRDGKYYMTKIVGKTASGADCILPSSAAGNGLASTGTNSQTLSAAALLLLMCGFMLLAVAGKFKAARTFRSNALLQ